MREGRGTGGGGGGACSKDLELQSGITYLFLQGCNRAELTHFACPITIWVRYWPAFIHDSCHQR